MEQRRQSRLERHGHAKRSWRRGEFPDVVAGTSTQDVVGGTTLGTISLTSAADVSRAVVNNNGITLNQDGSGPGFPTISNTEAAAGSVSNIWLSGGSLVLADDPLVNNTSASTSGFGAVEITSTISGAGNVTFNNSGSNNATLAGSIRVQTGGNTFTGAVLVQKGAVSYNSANAFGVPTNVITLGQNSQGP